MCNLYSLTPGRNAIGQFFRVSHNRSATFEPVNAIFTRHVAPVVRQSGDGEREVVLMNLRREERRSPSPTSATTRSRPTRSGVTVSGSAVAWASSFCEPKGDAKPAIWH
jgi:hypothetical protein